MQPMIQNGTPRDDEDPMIGGAGAPVRVHHSAPGPDHVNASEHADEDEEPTMLRWGRRKSMRPWVL